MIEDEPFVQFRVHTLLIVLALGMSVGWFLLAYVLLAVLPLVLPRH
jgi:hypothetical protein